MSSGAINQRERQRQALLDELRRAHRAEPAPAELRRRLLDHAEPDAAALRRALGSELSWGPRSLVARAAALLGAVQSRVVLGVLAAIALGVAVRGAPIGWLAGDEGAGPSNAPEVELGPEPPASMGIPAQSDSPAAATAERARQCPLGVVPSGTVLMPQHSGLPGFSAHTFEQMIPSCGPITRRYLAWVPPELAERTRAPVLILLHDAGEAAESSHPRAGRPDFEDVARRNGVVLIYANAAPGRATSVGVADSGAWQTDPRTHREIDDEEYLRLILMDLGRRRVIAGDNDIFLVGRGDGAAMALEAAARDSRSYTGVAAFEPSPLSLMQPRVARAGGRLSRVMLVVEAPEPGSGKAWDLTLPAYARGWASVLGLQDKVSGSIREFGDPKKPLGSLRQLDVSLPASGSPGVRVYILDGVVETRPNALHAWDFLTGADGAEPNVTRSSSDPAPELVPDLPMLIVPDGQSVLSEDAEGMGYPEVVLDGDTVTSPRRPARRQP